MHLIAIARSEGRLWCWHFGKLILYKHLKHAVNFTMSVMPISYPYYPYSMMCLLNSSINVEIMRLLCWCFGNFIDPMNLTLGDPWLARM